MEVDFFHPVNTKLISDGRNGIFPFHVAQLYICASWVQFWMQGINENHCRSVFTASTQQNFSYLGLEEGTDWCWGGWGSERQPTVKWNRINHISDSCGSIWGFLGAVQRHSMHCQPAVVGKGSRRSRSTAGALSQPGLPRVQGAILWETPKVKWGHLGH